MKNIFFLWFCLSSLFLSAQKEDYIWIVGNQNQTFDTTYGGAIIDFNFHPPRATYHFREQNMYTTNSSICDSAGNLLFFTNGCEIAGADDITLDNGNNINPGTSHTLWCETYDDGYSGGPANSIILPVPDSSGLFYLFHKRFVLYSNPPDAIIDKLYYTIIDMKQNGGKGKVMEKNTVLMSDTLSRGEIAAVKHANGKDWWLVTPRRNSNQFYIFKFTNQGVVDTFQQTIGILQGEGLGQMVFSPDGNKLFRTGRYKPVMVYHFDREAGAFTQFDTIHYEYGNQFVGEIMCALSPNNRFLYLSCRKSLYQFDLWASDVSASQMTVAEWDGFANPFPTIFWQCQLGPDCKIYIVAGGDTRYYHVIHNSDEPGLACNVEQRGLQLPTPSGPSMPSFPNYRLGPINDPGVPCTATVGVSQPVLPIQSKPVWVYPNPANHAITIEYTAISEEKPKVFMLFDIYGRLVKTEQLLGLEGQIQINTENLPAGVYGYNVAGMTGKVIIQH